MAEAIVKIKMDDGCDDLFPTKAHKSDAAFDLRSAENVVICKGETKAVSAGFCMALEEGWGCGYKKLRDKVVKNLIESNDRDATYKHVRVFNNQEEMWK